MSHSFQEIVAIAQARQRNRGALIQHMVDVRDRYNGDWVIPMPNVGDEAPLPPLTPALVQDAIDHTAMRAAGVTPIIYAPALRPGEETGRGSLEWAGKRRRALAAVRAKSKWNLKRRRVFRHLAGYATSAIVVWPDLKNELPTIKTRDPLTAFPEAREAGDLSMPANACFIYGKSADWIRRQFPQTRKENGLVDAYGAIAPVGLPRKGEEETDLWDIVEWIDEDECVIGLMGPRYEYHNARQDPMRGMYELLRYPNRFGYAPVIMPERVTLDRIAGQVSHMLGLTDYFARIVALDILASEKAIFPDRYIIGKSGNTPTIVGGRWRDGREGEPTIILDAENVGELRGTPDPNIKMTEDRMERNFRVSSGLNPSFGGESYGSQRSGRQVDAMLGASVDPRVQELHEVMEVAEGEINEAVLTCFEQWWPDKKFVLFSGWHGDMGHVEFTPATHLTESHETVVAYPIAGADISGTTVNLGQMVAAEMISKRTARQMHPWVPDADAEDSAVDIDKIREAIRVGLLERVASGGIPPGDMARLEQELVKGKTLAQATLIVDELAQQRQASAAPPPPDGMVAAPQTMPGLANPGEGNEMMPPEGGAPVALPPAVDQFREVTRALRAPQAIPDGRQRSA